MQVCITRRHFYKPKVMRRDEIYLLGRTASAGLALKAAPIANIIFGPTASYARRFFVAYSIIWLFGCASTFVKDMRGSTPAASTQLTLEGQVRFLFRDFIH